MDQGRQTQQRGLNGLMIRRRVLTSLKLQMRYLGEVKSQMNATKNASCKSFSFTLLLKDVFILVVGQLKTIDGLILDVR